MRIIACIEDPVVIKAILAHLAGKAPGARTAATAGPGAACAGPGAACAGLKRFTQHHRINRIFP